MKKRNVIVNVKRVHESIILKLQLKSLKARKKNYIVVLWLYDVTLITCIRDARRAIKERGVY